MSKKRFAFVAGDGIGVDVTQEALKALDAVVAKEGLDVEYYRHGGILLDFAEQLNVVDPFLCVDGEQIVVGNLPPGVTPTVVSVRTRLVGRTATVLNTATINSNEQLTPLSLGLAVPVLATPVAAIPVASPQLLLLMALLMIAVAAARLRGRV